MNTPEPAPLFQIPCRNLRSKEMYHQGLGQPEDEFSSGIHWCAKTQEGFGPDGQPAGKIECCCLERPCYIG